MGTKADTAAETVGTFCTTTLATTVTVASGGNSSKCVLCNRGNELPYFPVKVAIGVAMSQAASLSNCIGSNNRNSRINRQWQ